MRNNKSIFFLFVDGWNIYCNNGNKTYINKKDLKQAKQNGLLEEDIKIIAYNYLTDANTVEDIFLTTKTKK